MILNRRLAGPDRQWLVHDGIEKARGGMPLIPKESSKGTCGAAAPEMAA
jgi:hypothetical protein